VTPEGRTAVAAAHIVPWSFSRNDDPRNGMALCGLHHWTFDQGLLSIDLNYKVLVSPIVATDDETTTQLISLHAHAIRRPLSEVFWPSRSALQWHFENIYRADAPPRLL
jgi:putative restriction endonuclease